VPKDDSNPKIYSVSFAIDETSLVHQTVRYTWADFISDIGGVLELMIFLFGLLMYPIS